MREEVVGLQQLATRKRHNRRKAFSNSLFVNRNIEELKKAKKDTPESQEEESRPIIHSGFDDRLICNLPPSYTKPLPAIDEVGCSWALNVRQPACFCELGDDWKYEHVAGSRRVFQSNFAPRKRLLLKAVCAISTRYDEALRRCRCSEWEQSSEGNGRCLGEGAAAQRWTTSAVEVCSAPCRLAETKLNYPRDLCGPISAPGRMWHALNRPTHLNPQC